MASSLIVAVGAIVVTVGASVAASMVWNHAMGTSMTRPLAYRNAVNKFNTFCSACHSLTEDDVKRIGPSLHDIGAVAANRKDGFTAAEYIFESIVDPGAFRAPGVGGGMPSLIWTRLSDEDLKELVDFLARRGGRVSREELDQLTIPDRPDVRDQSSTVSLADIRFGEEVYRGKANCTVCHPLRPDAGYTLGGPSLLDIGVLDIDELRQSIMDPSAKITQGYEHVKVEQVRGVVMVGRITRRTQDGIHVLRMDSNGHYNSQFIPLSEIEEGEVAEFESSAASPMPSYEHALSKEEINALIAFLKNRHGSIPGYGRTGMFTYR